MEHKIIFSCKTCGKETGNPLRDKCRICYFEWMKKHECGNCGKEMLETGLEYCTECHTKYVNEVRVCRKCKTPIDGHNFHLHGQLCDD